MDAPPKYDAIKAAYASSEDRWVVVDSAARLYLNREGTRWLDGTAPTDDSGVNSGGFAMIDRGRDNGRARLVLAPLPANECFVDHAQRTTALALTVYVDPQALRRVTATAVEHAFADGTSVRVHPGVPVFDSGDGKLHTAVSEDLGVDVALDEEEIGTSFAPMRALSIGEANALPGSQADVVHFAGGRELQDIRPFFHRRIAASGDAATGFSALVGDDCISVYGQIDLVQLNPEAYGVPDTSAEVEEVSPFPDPDAGWWPDPNEIHDAIPPRPAPVNVVDVGSPLYMEDGAAIGVVREMFQLSGELDAPTDGAGLRCFDLNARLGASLPLCFDAHDIRQVDEFWADRRQPTKRAPAAALLRGLTDVEGALSVREVRHTMSEQAVALASCYQPVLARQGELDGEVRAWMIIDRDGRVERAGTLDPRSPDGVDHPRANRCMAEQLQTLRFGVGPAYVVQNFVLDSVRP